MKFYNSQSDENLHVCFEHKKISKNIVKQYICTYNYIVHIWPSGDKMDLLKKQGRSSSIGA